jgi:sugar phosphate permease
MKRIGNRPFLFYGWVIVGISFVSTILIYGIRHSFSVFFPHILHEFGWNRGDISIMLSLNIFFYGLLATVAGTFADRWRPRRFALFGITILSLATAGCAVAYKLWHFYFLFGFLVPLGSAFSGNPVLYPALMNWFTGKRGLVLGLSQVGGGLSFVYSLFVEFTISQLGWRNAYFVLAGVLLIFLFPLYLLFFYYRPEDKGLKFYGAAEPTPPKDLPAEGVGVKNQVFREWTLAEILRSPRLWFLVVCYALYWGVGGYLVLAHLVKFIEDVGYSSMFSVSIFALFGISLCMGQLSGFLSDWMGREKTGTLAASISICALCILIFIRDTSQPWLLYLFSICFGYGIGLFNPTVYASAADIFYGTHFGSVTGLVLMGLGVGGAIGPWLGGYLFDLSGRYTSAFVLCIISMSLACLCLWIAAPRKVIRQI